jgi:hypothetical protein
MARSCNLSELRAKKAKIIDVFEIKRSRESQVKTRKSQGTTTEQVKVNTTVKSRVSDKVKESTKSRNQVKQQNEKQATKGRNQGQVKIKFCPLHSIARDVIKDFTTIIQCVKPRNCETKPFTKSSLSSRFSVSDIRDFNDIFWDSAQQVISIQVNIRDSILNTGLDIGWAHDHMIRSIPVRDNAFTHSPPRFCSRYSFHASALTCTSWLTNTLLQILNIIIDHWLEAHLSDTSDITY